MRQIVASGLMALVLVLAPGVVFGQAETFDEETRSAVEVAAKAVGYQVIPSLDAPAALGQIGEEPVDESVVLPELNLTDLAEYSAGGVTIQVPADWVVESEPFDDVLFMIEVPGTDFILTLDADAKTELEFPSLLAITMFRSQAELLTREFGAEAQLEVSETVLTAQGLPAAKLVILGEDFGRAVTGAFYVVAPNNRTSSCLRVDLRRSGSMPVLASS